MGFQRFLVTAEAKPFKTARFGNPGGMRERSLQAAVSIQSITLGVNHDHCRFSALLRPVPQEQPKDRIVLNLQKAARLAGQWQAW
jgi:hypothetical protein